MSMPTENERQMAALTLRTTARRLREDWDPAATPHAAAEQVGRDATALALERVAEWLGQDEVIDGIPTLSATEAAACAFALAAVQTGPENEAQKAALTKKLMRIAQAAPRQPGEDGYLRQLAREHLAEQPGEDPHRKGP